MWEYACKCNYYNIKESEHVLVVSNWILSTLLFTGNLILFTLIYIWYKEFMQMMINKWKRTDFADYINITKLPGYLSPSFAVLFNEHSQRDRWQYRKE